MARRGGLIVLLVASAWLGACSSGSASSGGENFVSAPTSTTSLAQAFNGNYNIDIVRVETGPPACRASGTFHEAVTVEDAGATRRVTLTNTIPSADGQNEVEVGSVLPDGTFDAAGTFGSGTYAWHGTLPGDGTVSAIFTATTPAATCAWQMRGQRT